MYEVRNFTLRPDISSVIDACHEIAGVRWAPGRRTARFDMTGDRWDRAPAPSAKKGPRQRRYGDLRSDSECQGEDLRIGDLPCSGRSFCDIRRLVDQDIGYPLPRKTVYLQCVRVANLRRAHMQTLFGRQAGANCAALTDTATTWFLCRSRRVTACRPQVGPRRSRFRSRSRRRGPWSR